MLSARLATYLCSEQTTPRMIFSNSININILEFIRAGHFDYIKPGHTKAWILNNFPDPDDIGIGDNVRTAKIWFYGNIELHFDKEELSLIYSDSIIDLDGGKSLEINKWIFNDSTRLSLSKFINELNIEGIDFYKKTEENDNGCLRLTIFKSNVLLTFTNQESKTNNPNDFKLTSFNLMRQ